MTRKVILATVSALALGMVAVGFAVAAAPGPDYLDVTAWKTLAKNKSTAQLSVTTKAAIPKQPDTFIRSNPVVGLGWLDVQTSNVFVVTIHPAIGRDSRQNPRAWHAHTAALTGGAPARNAFGLAAITATPTAGISIQGATMKVNVRRSALPVPPAAIDAATGFTLQADGACASGLGVRAST